MSGRPTLWHLRDSHFNEKARWALDVARLPHTRRAPLAGTHMLVALALTGRPTLPVLVLDGEAVRGSAAIVATVAPGLIPDDPRALELEAFCGVELGPPIRRFSLFHLLQDERLCAVMTAPDAGHAVHSVLAATVPGLRRLLFARYGITPASAADARVRTVAALDRLEAEIADQVGGSGGKGVWNPDGYLVAGRFTVADLTAAAMLGPLLRPAGSPWAQLPWLPPAVTELKDEVERRPIGRWALDVYARHRDGA